MFIMVAAIGWVMFLGVGGFDGGERTG
jgi:hypothetical protein